MLQQPPRTAAEAALIQDADEAALPIGAGRRADLDGLYVRSSWEANYARYCVWLQAAGQILGWKYEPTTFWFAGIKRGVVSYKPDFAIWERSTDPDKPDYFVEVKGYDYARGVTARKRMAKYHPDVRLILVDQEAYAAIAQWRALIPGWETRRRGASAVTRRR